MLTSVITISLIKFLLFNFSVYLIHIVIAEITSQIWSLFEIVYSGYLKSIITLVCGLMLTLHSIYTESDSSLISTRITTAVYTIIT